MPDVDLRIRQALLERLERLSRQRHAAPDQLLEEALARYLDLEEHCEAMFQTYGEQLSRRRQPQTVAA